MADNTQIAVAAIGAIVIIIVALLAVDIIPWDDGGSIVGTTPDVPDTLSGRYSMDGMEKIVAISRSSGNTYYIEQLVGDLPWQGVVTLNGGRLLGNCEFTNSDATFVFEGIILGDKSIDGSFKYITDANGDPVGDRVDKHVFIPIYEG